MTYTYTYIYSLIAAALHRTILDTTTLHFISLNHTALHCTALHHTALHCTALHCTALGHVSTIWRSSLCLSSRHHHSASPSTPSFPSFFSCFPFLPLSNTSFLYSFLYPSLLFNFILLLPTFPHSFTIFRFKLSSCLLHYAIPCRDMLYFSIPAVSCCATPYHAVLRYAVLHYAPQWYALLSNAMPRHAMLCCTTLWQSMPMTCRC